MGLYKRNHSGLGLGLLALGFAMSVAGVANAGDTGAQADLNIVGGSVRSGLDTGVDNDGFQLLLDFSVPDGSFAGAADKLAGASGVDFNSSFSGSVAGLNFNLDANKAFHPGSAANFVRGDSGEVRFDNASFSNAITGGSNIDDPRAQVSNPTFSSDNHNWSNLTGGTFKLSGTNGALAALQIEGSGDAKGGGAFTAAPSGKTPTSSHTIKVGLTGIQGHLTSGDNAPDADNNGLDATLGFDLAKGVLSRIDLNDLEGINGSFADTIDGIVFGLNLDGELENVAGAGDVPGELDVSIFFRTPEEVANFFLGESQGIEHASFLALELSDDPSTGGVEEVTSDFSPTFDGDEKSLSTLTGGTLNVRVTGIGSSGLAGLNLDNDFVADDTSAGFSLDRPSGPAGPGDGSGAGSATVAAPSGYAMLLFMGIGVLGMGLLRRVRQT